MTSNEPLWTVEDVCKFLQVSESWRDRVCTASNKTEARRLATELERQSELPMRGARRHRGRSTEVGREEPVRAVLRCQRDHRTRRA